jgi:hypothetical protein
MPRADSYDDDEFDADDATGDDIERHLPSDEDMDSSDEPGVDACPHCRKLVSEEAEQCPHCGEYIVHSDAPSTGVPLWVWITAVAIIAFFIWSAMR